MFEFAAMIFKFIGGDVAKALVDAYKAKKTADTADNKIAADLAGQEVAAQVAETNAITQYRIAALGHWSEPDKLMGYIIVFLLGKIVVWDICLGLGTTDLHAGFVTVTANVIISFYFGKRGFENVAQILKKR